MNMQCNKYDEAYMHDAMIVPGGLQGTTSTETGFTPG